MIARTSVVAHSAQHKSGAIGTRPIEKQQSCISLYNMCIASALCVDRPAGAVVCCLFYLPTPAKHVCGAAVALPDRLFCIALRESISARGAFLLSPAAGRLNDCDPERAMTRAVTCWGRCHVRIESPVPICQPLQSPVVTGHCWTIVGYDCDTRHQIHIVAIVAGFFLQNNARVFAKWDSAATRTFNSIQNSSMKNFSCTFKIRQ